MTNAPATNREQVQLYQRAGMITFFTLLSRILGAIRDLMISHLFGAGMLTDAFIQAFTIPNVLRRLTAEGAMTLAFIPLYTQTKETKGEPQARLFAQKVLGLVLWSTILLSFLGILFSDYLVYLFAAGFASQPEKFQLTVDLTRYMFPYLIFVSLVAWAMGVLNAEKRFATPAAAPMLLNLGIIGSAIFFSPFFDPPILAIALGVILGGIMQVALQIPSLRTIQQSILPKSPWNDEKIKELLLLLGPSLLGVAVYQLNIIILRNIASFLPTGQVTYYYNSSRLTELVLGIFAFAFTMASFPDLSQQTATENWSKALRTIKFTFANTQLITIPATVGLYTISLPIVSMMYFHGEYTLVDAQRTATTLQAFALGIPAIASIRLFVAVFYALKDTKTPVLISCISLLFTGILGWQLSVEHEVEGLALGLSMGTWFQLLLLWLFLHRKPHFSQEWIPWGSLVRYLVMSGVIALFVFSLAPLGNWHLGWKSLMNWLLLFAMIGGASLLYFSGLLFTKEPQLQILTRRLQQKLKKSN